MPLPNAAVTARRLEQHPPSSGKLADLGRRTLGGQRLTRAQVLELVALGRENPHELIYWAHRLRTARFGNAVQLCCIVPGKLGGCREDCRWCAQSASAGPTSARARRTPLAEILQAARASARCGAACFCIVDSGRRPSSRDLDEVAAGAAAIRSDPETRCLHLGASLGELTDAQAHRLAAVGVVRYNHNLETCRQFFPQVVSTHRFDERLATLAAVSRAGMEICCGGLLGLGETWEDRVDLALMLRDHVKPECLPLNFLHPIPGTSLQSATPLAPMEILTIIAIFRLVLPRTDLRIAGGRTANLRDMQSWIFYAGATSTITGPLLTTTGRPAEEDLRMIADLGLRVVTAWPKRT